ncbi:MAG: hypothetical protein MI866_10240 [Bacteroidales bacterium]|nr:hypothetical protein [Bacteroidales bacterium]
MNWKNAVQKVKGLFTSPKLKEKNITWIPLAVKSLQRKMLENQTVRFRILEMRQNGFKVKIQGLNGVIPFRFMPWNYTSIDRWSHVTDYIKNQVFKCKVIKLIKSPHVIVVGNGRIIQFEQLTFTEGWQYQGIIISKKFFGIEVDFGYSFNWECGSFIQLISKHTIDDDLFEQMRCGDIYEATYTGSTEDINPEPPCIENAKKLINRHVKVMVKRRFNNQISLLVNGKYPGELAITRDYKKGQRNYLRHAIENLNDREVINCLALGMNNKGSIIILKWTDETEIKNAYERRGSPWRRDLRNI